MQDLLQSVITADLPIWSLMFINPRMAELKNRAPLMEHNGHPVEERVLLPAAYVLTLAYRKKDHGAVMAKLPGLLKQCEAELLSERIAKHEWENRFKLMMVKRLGPSLVPAEVVIPLNQLGKVMSEIERKIDQPLVKEGVVVRRGKNGAPEVVILGFIPSDQRKFSYNFVFPLVLSLMKIAESHGGRAYSTGLYFAKKAPVVLGPDRTAGLKAFKSLVDPKGLINPGKVIGNGLVGAALSLVNAFEYLGSKENCCATPMLVAGKWHLFVETMKKNIQAVREARADTVICSCPACDMMWRQVYPNWAKKLGLEFGITARHYSEVVSEKIKAGEFQFPAETIRPVTVTWHDSCHIGRASGVYEPPRELIKAIPNVNLVEMSHNRQDAHCCGSVLTLIKEPPVAADIGKIRLDEANEAGAEKVLALCPCCEFQLRISAKKKDVPMEVIDLARFASSALGYEFPDPHPEVQAQWAVFEAIIALMTPKGFADLMGTMLKRVAERIPMPDYMQEQMPDLMPKVMENLMPHMIGEVVPLVAQPMTDYLRGKENEWECRKPPPARR